MLAKHFLSLDDVKAYLKQCPSEEELQELLAKQGEDRNRLFDEIIEKMPQEERERLYRRWNRTSANGGDDGDVGAASKEA